MLNCLDECNHIECPKHGYDILPDPMCPEQSFETIAEHRIEILRSAIQGLKILKAPTRTSRVGDWVEFLIEIGKDETAFITMTKEAYEILVSKEKCPLCGK